MFITVWDQLQTLHDFLTFSESRKAVQDSFDLMMDHELAVT